jgi:hypothetical protein
MDKISRRDSLLYMAGLPLTFWLDRNLLQKRRQLPKGKTSWSGTSSGVWNIVLHGLYVIQWTSPVATADKPNIMRIIFPKVSSGHGHEYMIGKAHPGTQGYKLYFDTVSAPTVANRLTNVRFDPADVQIPSTPPELSQVAYCWLDLPQPTGIQPLRPRNKLDCCIDFTGTVGKKIAAQILPSVTLLQYNLGLNPMLDTDITPAPSVETNLIVRSEPPHAPADSGAGALSALRNCLGLLQKQFDIDGDCCPPDPDPNDASDFGVSTSDEMSLQEINGDHCSIVKCASKGIQIRACMTTVVGP